MTISDKASLSGLINLIENWTEKNNGSSVTDILALLCLLSIMNRSAAAGSAAVPAAAENNPLQKLLGSLGKSDSGGLAPLLNSLGAPEVLTSLMPLLNNPQIKSKLTSSNLASVMGLLNNLGSIAPAPINKEKSSKPETEQTATPDSAASSAARQTAAVPAAQPAKENGEKKSSHFLKWKTNF